MLLLDAAEPTSEYNCSVICAVILYDPAKRMGIYEDEYPCGCVAGTTTYDFPPKSYTIKRCSETEFCGIEIEKRHIERKAEEADRDLCRE